MNEMNCVGNTGSPGFVKTRSTGSHFARNATTDFIVSNSSAYCGGRPRLLKASTMHGKPFSRTRFPTLPALKQAASQAGLMTSMHPLQEIKPSSIPDISPDCKRCMPRTASSARHSLFSTRSLLYSANTSQLMDKNWTSATFYSGYSIPGFLCLCSADRCSKGWVPDGHQAC